MVITSGEELWLKKYSDQELTVAWTLVLFSDLLTATDSPVNDELSTLKELKLFNQVGLITFIAERGIATATSPFILLEGRYMGHDLEKTSFLQDTYLEVISSNPETKKKFQDKIQLHAWRDDPHAHAKFSISLPSHITCFCVLPLEPQVLKTV